MSESKWRSHYRLSETAVAKSVKIDNEIPATLAECPACRHLNPADSMFCAECGNAIIDTRMCPTCNAVAHSGADICERCGTWLLQGKCKFCLAPVTKADVFCSMCGNPQAGITCPCCGETSIFDFCRKCNVPLSKDGKEQAVRAKEDPAQQELLSVLQEVVAIDAVIGRGQDAQGRFENSSPSEKDQFLQMRQVRERAESASNVGTEHAVLRKPLFTTNQQQQIGLLGAQIQAEEERKRQEAERLRIEAERRRKAEEEQRRRLLEEVGRVLGELSNKTFSSNQEARRYFMSVIAALPEELRLHLSCSGSMKWRCNFANCEHNDPGECGDPSKGGVWLIR